MRQQVVLVIAVSLIVGSTASSAQMSHDRCASPLVTLDVERPLQHIVLETWRRSITFRRQGAHLANEPTLTVTVGLWIFGARPDSRAQTSFTRDGERLKRAEVQVRPGGHRAVAEFVAHELEHVLEQLDGVDLARMGGRGGVAVSRPFVRPHVETKRAQLVGRIVAAEYDAQHAVADGCLEARR